MFLAGAIFLFALVLVIWQPKGLSIGWSATIGAVLALVSGVIHINDTGSLEYRLERYGNVHRRHHHQPAAG